MVVRLQPLSGAGRRTWRWRAVVRVAAVAIIAVPAMLTGCSGGTGPAAGSGTAGGSPGTEKWAVNTEYPVRTSPAVGADGAIYVAQEERLVAFGPDGAVLWDVELWSPILTSPSVGAAVSTT